MLLGATVLALVWANSPFRASYSNLWSAVPLPEAGTLHLDLSLQQWAADGLLAVFFFIAGLEVKRELVLGELRRWKAAALSLVAAVAGMAALVFLAVARGAPGAGDGWAVPVATDIAFALGVLALVGSELPASLRVFLLSLAVVDDLGAIALIAVLYSGSLSVGWLAAAALLLGGYAAAQRSRLRSAWLHLPLAAAAWVAVHAAGVHATVAGVALGLLTRVIPDAGEEEAPGARLEHRLHPWSAGLVVPVFALASAGIAISGDRLRAAAEDPIAQGVVAGLVIGKFLGVFGGAWLAVRLRLGVLPQGARWADLAALGVLAGTGYTVSLLIAELAFADPAVTDRAKAAVLAGSIVAAGLGALLLRLRARVHAAANQRR